LPTRTQNPDRVAPDGGGSSTESVFEEALKCHRAGRVDEAEEISRRLLDAQPSHFGSLRLLASIDHQRGNYAAAFRLIEVALTLKPDSAEAFNSRGNALRKLHRLEEALASYDQAIALKPSYAGAFNNRGTTLHELKRLDEALVNFDQAIALNPGKALVFNNRGNALRDLNRLDEAVASYDLAIALQPDYADAYKNRGTAVQALGRLEEAVASYDQAIAISPNFAEAFNNRGTALHELKQLDRALSSYDRAIALKPKFVNAFVNRAMTRLLDRRFREGWEDYEWRWKANGVPERWPAFDAPNWQGEELEGRRIAIFAEQGLGDVLQFVRYLPLLAQRGAKVVFLAPAKLVRLLRPMSLEIDVVSSTDDQGPFDYQCALMTLPFRFATELSSIPSHVPYLKAERDRVARWATRLGGHGYKIGIAWQGIPERTTNRGRSIPLAEFFPLSQVSGVRLISLQREHGLDQLDNLPTEVRVETLGDEFDRGPDAFLDTAAVMANLDLIISSDTSIAHLAGALARPTWVALKYVPDWRWLLGDEECRWYPTMHLFRQETDGDWKGVFSKIEEALRLRRNRADR
jgi:tetratricopeptide (TPR) repeat protein